MEVPTATDAAQRHDTWVILLAAALLGGGAAALLLVGLVAGWWGLSAIVLLLVDVAVAVLLVGTHAVAPEAGHATRRILARGALGVGGALAALAPEWSPWWLRAVLVAAMVAVAVATVDTARGAFGAPGE